MIFYVNFKMFFYLIKKKNYGFNKPPLINNKIVLKEKVHLLDVLKEMDTTNKFFNLIEKDQTNRNPLDFFFESLNIKLSEVSK